MAATAVKIPVDSDGDQRQEVAGDERTIRGPKSAEQDTCGRRDFGEISKF